MKSLNLCQFIGNLGQDPELKYTSNGKAVANISVAVTDGYKDKKTGQKIDRTEWVRVVAFDRLAEVIGEYIKKGSKIYIQGKMTTRKWQDQSGHDRYTTEIVASEMQMLDSRGGDQSGGGSYSAAHQTAAPKPAPTQRQAPPPAMDNFDDDIPF